MDIYNLLNDDEYLTNEEKKIIRLRLKNKTYQEIAEIFNISRQGISKKIKIIRKKINEKLDD